METARGVKDFPPEEQIVREKLFDTITQSFKKFGFVPFASPIIERKDTLTFKFEGDEDVMSELFELTDNGDRELGLRFDLTIPLCRYVAMNKDLKLPFKRYEIGRVYRDGPIKAGRTREFWQCDADIVGSSSMMADAECIKVLDSVFSQLGFEYEIQVNNRKLLDELLESINISEKSKTITLLDKLAKVGVDELKKLFSEYLDTKQVSGIFSFIDKTLVDFEDSDAISELNELFSYLQGYENVSFTPSLARGLNYYTGTIYEVFIKGSSITGSCAAGGRYDKIIGQMRGDEDIPAVGCSFGIEPLTQALLEKQESSTQTNAQIFIAPIGVSKKAADIADTLRKQGYSVDLDVMSRSISKNLSYADTMGIPFVFVVGKRDLDNNVVTLKNMKTGEEEQVSLDLLDKLDLDLFR
jgi:histidyl-tRNA synthetase